MRFPELPRIFDTNNFGSETKVQNLPQNNNISGYVIQGQRG